ncbi:MAG: hypothetical protein A07HN63_00157, partial [uncultured archaeon A07HN63]
MAALRSLRPALDSIVRNPILLAVAALVAILQLPQFFVPTQSPMLSAVASLAFSGLFILFLPFYQGGLIGMADDAQTGPTEIGVLIDEGKANYLQLLLSNFVVLAIAFAFTIPIVLLVFLGSAGVLLSGGQPSLPVLGGFGLIGLVMVIIYFAAMLAIQFYAHAIVINETSIVDGFKQSIGLVRANLLSAIGYGVLLFGGGLVAGGIGGAASLLLSPQPALQSMLPTLSPPLVAGAALVYVLVL